LLGFVVVVTRDAPVWWVCESLCRICWALYILRNRASPATLGDYVDY
jgi:hypothetical protein